MYDLLEQHYRSLKNFVQNVSFDDAISCILVTDRQLADVEQFCTSQASAKCSAFGIDPTFNLGDFYVTVTTYENLMAIGRKTGKHPVFISASKHTYETYVLSFCI